MKGKKILYISSEVIPYMPQTEIATMTYSLPKIVNENGLADHTGPQYLIF